LLLVLSHIFAFAFVFKLKAYSACQNLALMAIDHDNCNICTQHADEVLTEIWKCCT